MINVSVFLSNTVKLNTFRSMMRHNQEINIIQMGSNIKRIDRDVDVVVVDFSLYKHVRENFSFMHMDQYLILLVKEIEIGWCTDSKNIDCILPYGIDLDMKYCQQQTIMMS